MPQRLPIVNSDDGQWGTILNQYLAKEHYDTGTDNAANGGHKTVTIQPGTATAGTAPLKLTSGTLMSAAEAGAVEFDTDNLYFTITTGTVRKKVALFDDTSGAAGDTYYREAGTTGKLITLPAGTANQQLTMVSGYPAWRDTTYPTSAKTSNYSIGASDTVIFANAFSAAVTITLPTPSSFAGYRFYIKRIDSVYANACTVATAGGSIDGQPTFTLNIQYMSVMVVSDGTGWFIL